MNSDPVFCLNFGIQSYRAGDFDQAINVLATLTGEEPDNWDARLYLGMSLYKAGQRFAAANQFNQIKSQCPHPDMRARAELAIKGISQDLQRPPALTDYSPYLQSSLEADPAEELEIIWSNKKSK